MELQSIAAMTDRPMFERVLVCEINSTGQALGAAGTLWPLCGNPRRPGATGAVAEVECVPMRIREGHDDKKRKTDRP